MTYKPLKKFDNEILDKVILQNLTPIQEQYLHDKHRFILNCSGRRSRKTLLGMYKGIGWALEEPGTYLFGAPTQDQAFEIFWLRLDAITKLLDIQLDKRLSPKPKIWIPSSGGGVSILKVIGLDVPARAEGSEVRFLHATEVPDIKDPTWWSEHVRPMFADDTTTGQRRAILDGVLDYRKPYWTNLIEEHSGGALDKPKYNEPVYKEDPSDSQWAVYDWHSEDVLHPDEINYLKKEYEEKLYLQEFGGQIITSGGRIYYAYTDKNDSKITFDAAKDTFLSFDFNVDPMTCTVWQTNLIDDITARVCVYEFIDTDSNVQKIVPKIIQWLKEQDFKPGIGQLILTGDHSATSRNHIATKTAWNIIEIMFEEANFNAEKFTKRTKGGGLREGQDTLNSRFDPFSSKPIYYINREQCPKLHIDLMKLKHKDNGQQNDEGGKRGHLSDTARYMCYNFDRIKQDIILTKGF